MRARASDQWQSDNTIQMGDCELILCNTRVNQKMIVCYVCLDPDYFLLVQLVSDTTVRLQMKQPLQQLSLQVDLQDPRNLLLMEL